MATKQELEVQVLDQQRTIQELTDKLERASAGLPLEGGDDAKLEALQREYTKTVDAWTSEMGKRQTLEERVQELERELRIRKEEVAAYVVLSEELKAALASQPTSAIDYVTDAKTVHGEIHNRNMDWDQPVAVLKRS